MTELEKLQAQKREIEEKIKALKNSDVIVVGDIKIDKEHYPTDKPDRCYIAVRGVRRHMHKDVEAWKSIISRDSMDELIEAIPKLISDIQELYQKAKVKQNEKAE